VLLAVGFGVVGWACRVGRNSMLVRKKLQFSQIAS